jgi:DMSO/TMAO reductase YedYZ molybdopterin-dependent catalytic subunit
MPDTSATSRPTTRTPRRWVAGGLAGLLAGTAAVAVSEAVAAVLTGVTSPLLAVGNRAVDATPRPLKELAIERFGSHDKAVLIGGVVTTVAVLAVLAGVVGVRRPRVALGAFLTLSAVAVLAAVTDRTATAGIALRLLPALALVAVGVVALLGLLRALRTPLRSWAPGGARVGGAPTRTGGSAASSPRPTSSGPDVLDSRTPAMRSAGEAGREGVEDGKPRLLIGGLLPSHVQGDDLPSGFDRRGFLHAAAAVGAVAAVGGGVRQGFGGSAAASQRADLTLPKPATAAPALARSTSLDVPGITPFLTSNKDFYRVDTALRVPDVPVDGYRLRIHGMVDHELELSYHDLLQRRMIERRITLTCVSNPVGGTYVGNATWLGVPVRDLLEEAGVRHGADAVKSTSADNMTIGTPLQALDDPMRDALIAVGMNGEPLPLAHGFPVRMVVPGLYGYVSATKWLVDLEVTRFADFKAYWSTRGYSVKAPIKTSSRIDVPRSFARVKTGEKVPVAGVAWSQDRGIRSVEVRVDGGAWQEAELARQDTIDTWRQWVWMWTPTSGNHTIEVRATDDTGYTQTDRRVPIAPNGSTGWHSVNVTAS